MRIMWLRKRILFVTITAIILFFLLRSHQYNTTFKKIIRYSKPIQVWEYVADFSNMKKLNPTMLDFNIVDESGNYDHWKYSAEYIEFLPKLPFIRHVTYAHFEVKPEGDSYLINSNHSTCFIFGTVCFPSTSHFRFTPLGSDTLCIEQISFSCPLILSSMCISDVKYQKDEVFKNLEKNFAHPHIFSTYM